MEWKLYLTSEISKFQHPYDLTCFSEKLSELFEYLYKTINKDHLLIVGITGDGGIGKSTLAERVATSMEGAFVVSTDGYLLDREQRRIRGIFTGDDPRAVDFNALINTITKIQKKKGVIIPKTYDHTMGKVNEDHDNRILTEDIRILIIEGAFALHPRLLPFLDFKIFLDANYSVRYTLRLKVDTLERGYSPIEFQTNWPQYDYLYEKYVKSNLIIADLIIHVTENWSYIIDPNDIQNG